MNIVFDLGGVVFRWQPDAIIASVFAESDVGDLVRKQVFEHADWVELDRGTLAPEQAIDRGAARTGLPVRDIERLLEAVPQFLTPIHPTIELIRQLRNPSNRLFVLSNMHLASMLHLERHYDIWELFDGVVVSSRVRKVKPEVDIYEHLLNAYRLAPADTVVIDDMQENLAAAASLGVHTIRFVDAAQCRQALAEL